MKKVDSLVIILLLFAFGCGKPSVTRSTSSAKSLPAWIVNRPVEPFYYTGIGAAKVNQNNAQHIDLAKSNALNDLVSEIEVTISGNSIIRQFEDDVAFKEEFQSMSQASIKDNISGYELVASWGDEDTYWVYYRLSKAHYKELKNREMERVKSLALDFYQKANDKMMAGEPSLALSFYLKGLHELRYYLNEEIFVEIDDENKYLANELVTEILELFSKTSLSISPTSLQTKKGQGLDTTIFYQSFYNNIPLSGLPFNSSFIKGAGSISDKSISNNSGKGKFVLESLNGIDGFQEIMISLDVKSIIGGEEKETSVLAELLSIKSSIPSALLSVKVSPVLAYYKVTEKEFAEGSNRKVISNEVKKQLSERNFAFTDSEEKADVIIELTSNASKGKHIQSHNVYTVYLDTYIALYKADTGTKIFYKGFDQIRGQQIGNWNNALKEAQMTTLEKVRKEIIPEVSNLAY